jgi:hypothetical protein
MQFVRVVAGGWDPPQEQIGGLDNLITTRLSPMRAQASLHAHSAPHDQRGIAESHVGTASGTRASQGLRSAARSHLGLRSVSWTHISRIPRSRVV